jgi:hypothetical protein
MLDVWLCFLAVVEAARLGDCPVNRERMAYST